MSIEITNEVCKFLNALPHGLCANAKPVSVEFKFNTKSTFVFYGAKFDLIHVCVPTERDVTDGVYKVGDRIVTTGYYLVGAVPEKFLKLQGIKYCFNFPDDDCDWFIAGYYLGYTKHSTNHPFGKFFTVAKWDHTKPWMGRIDQHGSKPSIRINTTVTDLEVKQ